MCFECRIQSIQQSNKLLQWIESRHSIMLDCIPIFPCLFVGKVVDQEALVEALQNKVIQAAALDVTYPEPLPR